MPATTTTRRGEIASTFAIGLLIDALATPEPGHAAAACAAPIDVGLTTALTGPLAPLGVQARNGVEFAIDDVNRKGGIAGQGVKLTVEDTGASSTDALTPSTL